MSEFFVEVKNEVVGGESIQAVSARDLHLQLSVGKDFSNWIKDRINQYGFIENADYIRVANNGGGVNQGFQKIEYFISLEMAKELSMVERTDKGKEARQYFIKCEKIAKEKSVQNLPQTYIEALKSLVVAEEQKELLRIENSKLNTLLDREFGYVSTIRAAKFIGCHENYFNWRSLKAMTKSLGMEYKRVPSPRFEYMNLYPIRAFELCYPELDFDDLKPELIDDKQSLEFSAG